MTRAPISNRGFAHRRRGIGRLEMCRLRALISNGRLGRWRVGRWGGEVGGGVGLDADEVAADGEHVADLAAPERHPPGDGGVHLDGGLVGEHLGEHRVGVDGIPDGHLPADQLGLGHTLADVRQSNDPYRHR